MGAATKSRPALASVALRHKRVRAQPLRSVAVSVRRLVFVAGVVLAATTVFLIWQSTQYAQSLDCRFEPGDPSRACKTDWWQDPGHVALLTGIGAVTLSAAWAILTYRNSGNRIWVSRR